MDALEKATDTRIYDCPEYGEDKVDEEEVIYEEAGKKLQQINVQVQSSPKRRKRATVSALGNLILVNGILLQKLIWLTVRKNCSSDLENVLKFEAEGREFAKILRSLEQFIQTVKGQNNFW